MLKHLLTILLFLPALGAIAVAMIRNVTAVRWTVFGTAVAAFLTALGLFIPFHWRLPAVHSISQGSDQSVYGYERPGTARTTAGAAQLVERAEIASRWHVQYLLGIDGLSLPLVLATTLLFAIAAIASWNIGSATGGLAADNAVSHPMLYFSLFLLLETTVLGVLLSLDFVFFWVFLTASSLLLAWLAFGAHPVPRALAMTRFVLYMLASSVLVLIVLLALHGYSRAISPDGRGSFDLLALFTWRRQHPLTPSLPAITARRLFLLLLAAFIIRIGAFPLHYWQSDFHAHAGAPISMLASITLLATGGYGILRVACPLFPQAIEQLWLLVAVLGVAGILYGALLALAQRDLNRLLAGISVATMGLFLLGCATLTEAGWRGALFTLIAWAITSAAMFFISGILFQRLRHRNILRLGGLAETMSFYFQFVCAGFLASAGLPAFGTFIGQTLVVLGIFQIGHSATAVVAPRRSVLLLAVLTCGGLILLEMILLRAMQRIYLGPPRAQYPKPMRDLDAREALVLTILIVISLLLGVLPGVLVFGYANATLSGLLQLFR